MLCQNDQIKERRREDREEMPWENAFIYENELEVLLAGIDEIRP